MKVTYDDEDNDKDNNQNGEEGEGARDNPPTPKTPRTPSVERSRRTPSPDPRSLQSLRVSVGQKIRTLVENEDDDDKTLLLGSEDEGFKSCEQEEVPFRDGSEEHPYEDRLVAAEARE